MPPATPPDVSTSRQDAGIRPLRKGMPDSPKRYMAPKPRLGQTVLWYQDRHTTEANAAVVAEVGDFAISVQIFVPGAYQMLPHHGVRHRSDPDKEIIDAAGEGVWDFCGDDEAVMQMASKEIAELRSRVDTLESLIMTPKGS